MVKNNLFETDRERECRQREERVIAFYLRFAHEILSGEIPPGRLIRKISDDENMSIQGVTKLLKRKGVYKSAQHPVIRAGSVNSQQLSLAL